MFLKKYLDETYLNLLYNTYEEKYINNLDEKNFNEVYNLLIDRGFYFVEDVVIKYLELFEIEPKFISLALNDMEKEFGKEYVFLIGNHITLLERVLDKAIKYSLEEEL